MNWSFFFLVWSQAALHKNRLKWSQFFVARFVDGCWFGMGWEHRYAMGLYDTFGKASKPDSNPGVRPIELYMCSVVKRMGYADGECICLCVCPLLSIWCVALLCVKQGGMSYTHLTISYIHVIHFSLFLSLGCCLAVNLLRYIFHGWTESVILKIRDYIFFITIIFYF